MSVMITMLVYVCGHKCVPVCVVGWLLKKGVKENVFEFCYCTRILFLSFLFFCAVLWVAFPVAEVLFK